MCREHLRPSLGLGGERSSRPAAQWAKPRRKADSADTRLKAKKGLHMGREGAKLHRQRGPGSWGTQVMRNTGFSNLQQPSRVARAIPKGQNIPSPAPRSPAAPPGTLQASRAGSSPCSFHGSLAQNASSTPTV